MKCYTLTVDDNIRFLAELTRDMPGSIFDHPYLALLRSLHERDGARLQLNLFYECPGFDLSMMTDAYKDEWEECSGWLKLSFHSRLENVKPYIASGYGEVRADIDAVNREILRFASPSSLAKTTTVHYCQLTGEGVSALFDAGVRGLLGLYGTERAPEVSYRTSPADCERLRRGETVADGGMIYRGIDIVLNKHTVEEIALMLTGLSSREMISVMIHEQYFYPDYAAYQPSFGEKLEVAASILADRGYRSVYLEELIPPIGSV